MSEIICNKFKNLIKCKISILNKLSPFSLLALRVWLGLIFYKSAVLKLPYSFLGVGQGNWDSTIFLFTYEHPIPYIPGEVAAYLGTYIEFFASIMLFIGFGTRFAAFLIFAMTLTIQLTYQQTIEHINWMLMSQIIIFLGAGKLSIDHLISKKLNNE